MKILYILLTFILFLVAAEDENLKKQEDIIRASALKHWKNITSIFLPIGQEILGKKVPRLIKKDKLLQVGSPKDRVQKKGSAKSIGILKSEKKVKESISHFSRAKRCKPSKKCKKANGKCISIDKTCNGRIIDKKCKPRSRCKKFHCCAPSSLCRKPKGICKRKGGKCIGKNEVCQGQTISKGCKKKEGCKCCVEEEECSDEFWCRTINDNGVCQKPSEACDGDQLLGQCKSGSDCVCCTKWPECPSQNYKCKVYSDINGSYSWRCLADSQVCDGFVDCHFGDDEQNCTVCAPDEFRCKHGECVSQNKICDGTSDCSTNKDEADCTWSYDGRAGTYGPEKWSILYPNCNGSSQSPISLGPNANDADFNKISFYNYAKNITGYMVSSVQLPLIAMTIDPSNNISIQGGGISPRKALVGCLIHWGSDSSKGSDHAINEKRYPMEMQLLSATSDCADPDCGTVLSIMFEISEADNPALDPIIQAASVIAGQGKDFDFGFVEVENLQFSGLLPSNTQDFYRYNGSITFPPCDEGIQWTVFTHTSMVSENQINVLRSIKFENKSISNNFRPLQPMNERLVLLNKQK